MTSSSNQDGAKGAGQSLNQFLKGCLERGKERQRLWRESCLDIASWTFGGTDGLLRFQLQCGLETAYAAQIVGSWNENTQTFLWSWANDHIPDSLSKAASEVYAIGEERGWDILTERKPECDEELALSLVCAASELTDLPVFYRGPAGNGLYVYFIFDDKAPAKPSVVSDDQSASDSTDGENDVNEGVEGEFGDFSYCAYEDGVVIAKYNGEDSEVEIPATINDAPVVEIGRDAFSFSDTIQEIVVPENVQAIGTYAFLNCSELETVELPKSLKVVGYCAFSGCSELRSIDIPDGVTTLGEGTFEECENLRSVSLPKGLAVLPSGVFNECCSLESIELPEELTEIGQDAFGSCESLATICLPRKVSVLVKGVFNFCKSLRKIEVDPNNESFKSVDGVLFSRDGKILFAAPGGKSEEYVVPEGTEIIATKAFAGCSNVTSVKLPESVRRIENAAFFRCSSLKSIELPSRLEFLGNGAFEDCESLSEFTVPQGITSIDDYMFGGCKSLKKVVIPKEVVEFGKDVFNGCENVAICSSEDSPAIEYAQKESIAFVVVD
ncbi:MAG: leucine-rich repeat domain-containing protein [Thermoguttaceae bacterium]|nr:leucine-rich repeat domain-containing protein [Thermoguttaceae bacterium]